MAEGRKRVVLLLLLGAAGLGIFRLWQGDYLTLETFRQHQANILLFVERHRPVAMLLYIGAYLATALAMPGALVLTVAGGMLFGTVPAVICANIGATLGSTLAFLVSRHLIGHWFQGRFRTQLASFNDELSRHGPHYLLILRILPVVPFFVVNYGAGLTRIRLTTFLWTTSLGMLPGSLIYAHAGSQLRTITSGGKFLSPGNLLALLLLSLFALLPVLMHHLGRRRGR